jgi:hypothetical protein
MKHFWRPYTFFSRHIRVDPNGWTEQSRGYVSVFLYSELNEAHILAERKVTVSYTFKITNFTNDALSIRRGLMFMLWASFVYLIQNQQRLVLLSFHGQEDEVSPNLCEATFSLK